MVAEWTYQSHWCVTARAAKRMKLFDRTTNTQHRKQSFGMSGKRLGAVIGCPDPALIIETPIAASAGESIETNATPENVTRPRR